MRVTSFGSGSSGNAFLIQSDQTQILVDVGIPIRALRSGLAAANVEISSLAGVFISHEHHDHFCSLERLIGDREVPCFASRGTAEALQARLGLGWQTVRNEESQTVGNLRVTAFSVSHDAAEPVGFLIDDGATRVALFTDLGETTPALIDPISSAHLVVLEANYDESMLSAGRYPAHLKRRIRGANGHLSNPDCARFLAASLDSVTTDIWLAHLSENNNRPTVARKTIVAAIGEGSGLPQVQCLPRRGATTTWDSDQAKARPRQAMLPLF